MKETDFKQLFKPISPEEINDNVFTLAGKILPVVTAGNPDEYNSMTASGGGLGLLFMKPTTWLILRGDRYTLELIQKKQSYTLSYFPKEYRKQVLFLGSKSGRMTKKMSEVKLTSIQTPAGDVSYKEAGLIIECKLTALTIAHPNDYCTPEAKNAINEAYKEAKVYRKFVFGEIVKVWAKK